MTPSLPADVTIQRSQWMLFVYIYTVYIYIGVRKRKLQKDTPIGKVTFIYLVAAPIKLKCVVCQVQVRTRKGSPITIVPVSPDCTRKSLPSSSPGFKLGRFVGDQTQPHTRNHSIITILHGLSQIHTPCRLRDGACCIGYAFETLQALRPLPET